MKEDRISADWTKLIDAGRSLVTQGGLRKLSIRSIASASGWTMGELAYRIGKKDKLVAELIMAEREAARAATNAWFNRLASIRSFNAPTLVSVIGAYLDDNATNRREATIFWEDVLLEASLDHQLSPLVVPWIDEREAAWGKLLEGRHPKATVLARCITHFVTEEQPYTIILGNDPNYRLLRDLCIRRLNGGILAAPDDPNSDLFQDLLDRLPSHEPPTEGVRDRAMAAAGAAATVMMQQGLSAVTYRSVAAELGQSASAVAHHFPTHMELIKGGIEALYESFHKAIDAHAILDELGGDMSRLDELMDPTRAGATLERATHMITLAALRDPAFAPLVATRRKERGRTSQLWMGQLFTAPHRFDRCSAQVTSLVMGGATINTLARGHSYSGHNPEALADLAALEN